MKTSETMIATLREVPAEAVIASHQLMLRAGLMRKLGNGLFSYLPLGLRVFRKVEQIIREEMDAIGAMECKPSVVVPGELWQESGRWETMGSGMLRAKNRLNQDLVVSPTAEEVFTDIVRGELSSYKQLPLILYQINTKFRDEIRPRYGVMRGREFTMKDAYSFHATQESLDETYQKFAQAYRRIFKRLGLSVIPVRANSGAMGGSGSEEFMVESEIGDDTLILCPKCGYAANTEKAVCAPDAEQFAAKQTELPIEKVPCPGVESISQMETFFKMPAKRFIKVLIYKVRNCALDLTGAPGSSSFARVFEHDGTPYYPEAFFAVAIRGDLDVNEAKLAAVLKASETELAGEDDVIRFSGAPHGFVGPVNLTKLPLIADDSVMTADSSGSYSAQMHDAVTGGGQADIDFIHVEPVRDFVPFITGDIRTVVAGDKCCNCGAEYYSKKGNELGHIFKLGYKYTKSMNVSFLDENGKQQTPLMGCYGIGVDRVLASIIEEHHDGNGIIWPATVTPYQAAVIPVKYEGAMKTAADEIYQALLKAGIETILDDRAERPGVKFKDADLIGYPMRIVVSDKHLPNVELKLRSSDELELVPAADAAQRAANIIGEKLSALRA
ncbi:MAG: proline--tRNA ligase [Bacteroides sp.]|nr:proline--tRNA ligase [Prevotella sp.]MCM1407559.1 proline--tRNA ligase [Treponema brennaborense]MCM1469291.1 proline--tRNA ligase [Bacteroides sp.]